MKLKKIFVYVISLYSFFSYAGVKEGGNQLLIDTNTPGFHAETCDTESTLSDFVKSMGIEADYNKLVSHFKAYHPAIIRYTFMDILGDSSIIDICISNRDVGELVGLGNSKNRALTTNFDTYKIFISKKWLDMLDDKKILAQLLIAETLNYIVKNENYNSRLNKVEGAMKIALKYLNTNLSKESLQNYHKELRKVGFPNISIVPYSVANLQETVKYIKFTDGKINLNMQVSYPDKYNYEGGSNYLADILFNYKAINLELQEKFLQLLDKYSINIELGYTASMELFENLFRTQRRTPALIDIYSKMIQENNFYKYITLPESFKYNHLWSGLPSIAFSTVSQAENAAILIHKGVLNPVIRTSSVNNEKSDLALIESVMFTLMIHKINGEIVSKESIEKVSQVYKSLFDKEAPSLYSMVEYIRSNGQGYL